jgi:hypothetical protein
METKYIPVAIYQDQQVYYDILSNRVYIEKDHSRLVSPSVAERKGLVDEGIVRLVDGIIKEIEIKGKLDI